MKKRSNRSYYMEDSIKIVLAILVILLLFSSWHSLSQAYSMGDETTNYEEVKNKIKNEIKK